MGFIRFRLSLSHRQARLHTSPSRKKHCSRLTCPSSDHTRSAEFLHYMVMQVQQHLNVEYNVEYRTKARRHMTTARDTACLAPTHCFTLWSQSLQTVSTISSGNHRYLRLTSTQPDVSSSNVTCSTMPDRLRPSPLSQYHHAHVNLMQASRVACSLQFLPSCSPQLL